MKKFNFQKWLSLLPKRYTIMDCKLSDYNTDDKTFTEDNCKYLVIKIREE